MNYLFIFINQSVVYICVCACACVWGGKDEIKHKQKIHSSSTPIFLNPPPIKVIPN